jgi:hypothetical protein
LPSSLAKRVLLVFPGKRCSLAKGALRTKDSIVGKVMAVSQMWKNFTGLSHKKEKST